MSQGFGNERQILWADYGFLDLSGSEDDGTAGSGVTIVSDNHGNSHKAFDLTGSGGILSTLTQSFGTSDFSIGLWVKTTETAADYLFGADGGGTTSEISSRMHTSRTGSSVNNRVNVYVFADDDTRARIDENSSSIFGGTWKHVVLTRSGGTLELWYDGTKQTPSTYQMTLTESGEVNLGVPIVWGGLNSGGTPTAFPVARLNDMRVFDYKLTDTQIGDWYDNGAGYNLRIPTASVESPTAAQLSVPHGPLIHLASGSGVVDQSAYQQSGISYEGGMGVSGGAYFFDGSDDYIDLDTFAGVLSDLAPTSFSGSVWIKTESDASHRVIWFATHDSIRQGVYVRLESTGHIRTFFGTNQVSWAGTLSTGTVDDDQWHHIVVTWEDGVGGKCYIDGVLDGTDSDTDTLTWTTVTKGALGKDTRTSQTSIFDGYADGLDIYAYTLTPAEITTLYNADRQPNYTHPRFDRPRNIPGTVLALRGETGAIDQSDYNQTGVEFVGGMQVTNGWFVLGDDDDAIEFSTRLIPNGPSTISFSLQTTDTNGDIICQGSDYRIKIRNDGVSGSYGVTVDVATLYIGSNSPTITDGATHHIAITNDGTNVKFYYDGVLSDTFSLVGWFDIDANTKIGWYNQTSTGTKLDDIRFINRALSAGEIANLAAGGSGDGVAGDAAETADSVLELRGPTGLTDQSRLQQGDVTAAGDAYADASGFHFDGTGDYVEAPACGFGSSGEGTAAAFVTLDSKPSFAPIIVEGEEGSILAEDFSIQVDYHQSSDRFRAVVFNGNSATVVSANTFGAPTIGEIYHVAAVWTGTNLQIYVNGALSDSTSATTTNTLTGAKTYIGYQNQASARYFDGTIDDVRIIPRALSASEIAELVTPDKFKVLALDPADYSGTGNLLDSSGEGNDATFNGNAAVEGGVLVLDGTGDYLEVADSNSIDMVDDFCWSCWLRIDSDWHGTIVDKGTWNLAQVSGNIRFTVDGVNVSWGRSSDELEWTHLLVQRDGTRRSIFADGVEVAWSTSGSTASDLSDATNLTIGTDLTGAMTKCRLYSEALTAAQIRDLYYEDRPLYQPVGLLGGEVAAWRPDRWIGHGDLLDESGGGYDGTLVDGVTVTSDVLRLNGSTGYVDFGGSSDLLPATADCTISGWVKLDSVPATSATIFAQYTGSVGNGRCLLRYVDGTGFQMFLGNVGAFGTTNVTGSTTVTFGEWYHIAVTRDGGEWVLYVNGESDGTLSESSGRSLQQTGNLIGARAGTHVSYTDSLTDWFDGDIAELRIHHRTLDLAEVKALASARPFDTPNTLGSSLFVSPSTQHAWGSGEDVAVDLSGNANNGTLTNMDAATDWVTDTDSDGVAALDFDGSDDLLDFGVPTDAIIGHNGAGVVWFNTTKTDQQTLWYTLNTVLDQGFFRVVLNMHPSTGAQATGNFQIFYRTPANDNIAAGSTANNGFTDGAWHCLKWCYSKSAGTIRAWLDGAEISLTAVSSSTGVSDVTYDRELYFGESYGTGISPWRFEGTIDCSPIYTRELTDEQIALWAQSRSPFADPVVVPSSGNSILPWLIKHLANG